MNINLNEKYKIQNKYLDKNKKNVYNYELIIIK